MRSARNQSSSVSMSWTRQRGKDNWASSFEEVGNISPRLRNSKIELASIMKTLPEVFDYGLKIDQGKKHRRITLRAIRIAQANRNGKLVAAKTTDPTFASLKFLSAVCKSVGRTNGPWHKDNKVIHKYCPAHEANLKHEQSPSWVSLIIRET